MNNLNFLLNSTVLNRIDIIVTICVAIIFFLFLMIKIKKLSMILLFFILIAGYISSICFSLNKTSLILEIVLLSCILICVLTNITAFKNLFSDTNILNINRKKNKDAFLTDEESQQETYKKINEVVKILSKTKTGALITFEKNDDLSEIMKNGSIINTPVTVEIIQTIFYPGTRLHDGAIVIKGNTIIAASVYYTPTTRALTGKYGSRHRAAIGISEISDAVTVVVSEETGRVSLAYKGELRHVILDNFYDEFTELMNK